MNDVAEGYKKEIRLLQQQLEEVQAKLNQPKKELENQVRKELRGELMSKVKHFKDETFGELQALEIENEQLHRENLRLKERVRLLEEHS